MTDMICAYHTTRPQHTALAWREQALNERINTLLTINDVVVQEIPKCVTAAVVHIAALQLQFDSTLHSW